MKIIRAKDYKDMSRKAANIISAQVIMKPNCVLGLATGGTPVGTYKQLIDWYNKGDLDFAEVTTVNLDEYRGLPRENAQSYWYFMHDNLFNHVNIDPNRINLPDGTNMDAEAECKRYDDVIHSVGGIDLQLLGIASIFVCVMLVCSSVLQASGFVNLPIVIMVAGCAAKLIVNNFMVRHVGAVGAAVGTLVCYVIVAVLELLLIKRVIPSPPEYTRVFAKPMVAAGVMGMAVWAAYGLVSRFMGNTLSTMAAIGVGVVVYAVLVVVLKAISREDLSLMPKGDKIARLLRL